MLRKKTLIQLYERLYCAYGPQHWWPANSPFEVMVGAVLTQNTAWTNVEKAVANLRKARKLSLKAIHTLDHNSLAEYLQPSGYFNIKSKRLKNLCAWLYDQGGFKRVSSLSTTNLRQSLLSVNGIGPETADDILLYAFERPVFVIDVYTRRLLKRMQLIQGDEDYEELRQSFEAKLEPDVAMFNEYHALIVRHAKQRCSGDTGIAPCLHCRVEAPIH